MQVQVGKVYKVFGSKRVKVVKVDSNHIHAVHPNGMVPARQSDRLFPIDWSKHFTEVSN